MTSFLYLTLLLLTALVSTTPAHANIILDAQASMNSLGIMRYAGYNSFGVFDHGVGGYFNGPGFRLHDTAPPCTGSCASYSLSNSGLSDTVGNASSGYISSRVVESVNLGGNITAASADAYAGASLGSGTVQVSGQGTYLDPNSGQIGGQSDSSSELNDRLHFRIAGASADTTTLIGVSLTLGGLISGSSGYAGVSTQLNFGNAYLVDNILASPASLPHISSTYAPGWSSYSFSSNAPDLITFNGVYALNGPQVDLAFVAAVGAESSLGMSYDYIQQLQLTGLPSNVTYTSDSGVFLTSALAPTPEPGTIALFGAGLAALALLPSVKSRDGHQRRKAFRPRS